MRIVTSHPPSVEEVVRFIYRLQNESVIIDDAFLNRIAKLKILKRVPQLPNKAKKTLILQFLVSLPVYSSAVLPFTIQLQSVPEPTTL